jgi:UDP-2,3-diacylglucosamine hydrolase
MPAAPVFLLSDAHLGAAPVDVERALLRLLARARDEAGTVILNGDMFDFWFEWRHAMPRTGYRFLAALAGLRDAGIPVIWIAGNHDCWGGDLLRGDVGVDYRFGPWRGDLAGWQSLIEHGDGLREKEDAPYRRLRTVLRNPLAIRLFGWLHPDLATRIALRSSHTSRNMRPRDEGAGLRRVAMARLATDPSLDLCVFGHTHAQALEREPAGGVYANPGAFLDEPTFLRISAERIELMRLDDETLTVLQTIEKRRR